MEQWISTLEVQRGKTRERSDLLGRRKSLGHLLPALAQDSVTSSVREKKKDVADGYGGARLPDVSDYDHVYVQKTGNA